MQIRLNSTILALGHWHNEPPTDLSLEHVRTVQIHKFLGSANIQTSDKHNIQHTLSFKVTRHHRTLDEAQKFILNHSTTLENASGTLQFLSDPNTITHTMPSTCLTQLLSTLHGTSTTHLYTLVGGSLLSN